MTAPERCPGYGCEPAREWYQSRRDKPISDLEYPPGHFWHTEGGYLAHEPRPCCQEAVSAALSALAAELDTKAGGPVRDLYRAGLGDAAILARARAQESAGGPAGVPPGSGDGGGTQGGAQ